MENTKDENAEAVRSAAWLGKSGFDALREWNHTFKHHHLPMWAKKRIRLLAIECGKWKAGITIPDEFLPHKVFDHWGSIERGDQRALYAMPYAEQDALAEIWAETMDCTLESFSPAPWNESTKCYIFFPNIGAVPAKTTPTTTGGIVGMFVHVLKDGNIHNQGRVISHDSDFVILQRYGWIDGRPTDVIAIPKLKLYDEKQCTMYSEREDMMEAYERFCRIFGH